jgi:hypothetical protein
MVKIPQTNIGDIRRAPGATPGLLLKISTLSASGTRTEP